MPPCPNFIAGAWHVPAATQTLPVYNPSRGEVIAETPRCDAAFPAWSDAPPTERARIFFRFKILLEDHFGELARSVTREHGKTAAEARGDVRRGIEMVEFACGIPSLLMGEILPNVARGIDCDAIRQPLGVCAGERCMAGSTAVVVGDAAKRFLPPLIDATKAITVGPTDTGDQPGMGPVITRAHADRVCELIEHGRREGATIAADGRGVKIADAPNGFFVGATILDNVQPGTTVHHEEIFGPVLNVMRFDDLDAAIELANKSAYGNGASIFTCSGKAAREFKTRVKAGMVGINIGVPASMAWFPFNGWDDKFFRRPAHAGTRGRAVLHAAKGDYLAVVQLRRRQHLGRPLANKSLTQRTRRRPKGFLLPSSP